MEPRAILIGHKKLSLYRLDQDHLIFEIMGTSAFRGQSDKDIAGKVSYFVPS